MTDLTEALAAQDSEFANAMDENKRKRKLAVTLRSLRNAASLTQTAVAERSGLKQSHISKLESATGAMPTLETLLRYAAACNAELSLDFNLTSDEGNDATVLDVSVSPGTKPATKAEPQVIVQVEPGLASSFRVVKGALTPSKRGPVVPLAPLSKDQVRAVERGEKVRIRTEEVIETVVENIEFHVSLA